MTGTRVGSGSRVFPGFEALQEREAYHRLVALAEGICDDLESVLPGTPVPVNLVAADERGLLLEVFYLLTLADLEMELRSDDLPIFIETGLRSCLPKWNWTLRQGRLEDGTLALGIQLNDAGAHGLSLEEFFDGRRLALCVEFAELSRSIDAGSEAQR
jgi:hypothetical protein